MTILLHVLALRGATATPALFTGADIWAPNGHLVKAQRGIAGE